MIRSGSRWTSRSIAARQTQESTTGSSVRLRTSATGHPGTASSGTCHTRCRRAADDRPRATGTHQRRPGEGSSTSSGLR
ncbi:hypothetical protein BJF80_14850 [Serinicoccus sp. CUA-874]|nr:hypothetical protein BJF80_14850 [Serinicoccus sp. CUA-874]